MTVDEIKSGVETELLRVGIGIHPNGSGWFQSPNGKWLCSFISMSADANLMAMLDPSDGSVALFNMMGGIQLKKEPFTPEEQASIDEAKQIGSLLDTAVITLVGRDRDPLDAELLVVGRLYFKLIKNLRSGSPIEPKPQRHAVSFEHIEEEREIG